MSAHVVYRMRSVDDELLYVGCSSNLVGRLKDHAKRSPWFGSVASIDLFHFATREAALAAERVAIKTERPTFNVQPSDIARRASETRSRRWQEALQRAGLSEPEPSEAS